MEEFKSKNYSKKKYLIILKKEMINFDNNKEILYI